PPLVGRTARRDHRLARPSAENQVLDVSGIAFGDTGCVVPDRGGVRGRGSPDTDAGDARRTAGSSQGSSYSLRADLGSRRRAGDDHAPVQRAAVAGRGRRHSDSEGLWAPGDQCGEGPGLRRPTTPGEPLTALPAGSAQELWAAEAATR